MYSAHQQLPGWAGMLQRLPQTESSPASPDRRRGQTGQGHCPGCCHPGRWRGVPPGPEPPGSETQSPGPSWPCLGQVPGMQGQRNAPPAAMGPGPSFQRLMHPAAQRWPLCHQCSSRHPSSQTVAYGHSTDTPHLRRHQSRQNPSGCNRQGQGQPHCGQCCRWPEWLQAPVHPQRTWAGVHWRQAL